MQKFFRYEEIGKMPSIAALLLRLCFGGFMVYGHAWTKVLNFAHLQNTFADPLGVGSWLSLILALFAELICASLVTLGAVTRYALVPLIITMAVAFFVVHADDPFGRKEMAGMYGIAFIAIFCLGPGRYSLDKWQR